MQNILFDFWLNNRLYLTINETTLVASLWALGVKEGKEGLRILFNLIMS